MKHKDVAVALLSILASENIWWFTQVLEPVRFTDFREGGEPKGYMGEGVV